jgi:hypothetical protein
VQIRPEETRESSEEFCRAREGLAKLPSPGLYKADTFGGGVGLGLGLRGEKAVGKRSRSRKGSRGSAVCGRLYTPDFIWPPYRIIWQLGGGAEGPGFGDGPKPQSSPTNCKCNFPTRM